jgi:hypothetical protein
MIDSLPILKIRIGDEITAVDRASGVKTGLRRVQDFDLFVYQTPLALTYADPRRPFSLPPTRFVSLDLALCRVARIVTSPQVGYVDTDEMRVLSAVLFGILERAGWPGPRDAAAAVAHVEKTLGESTTDEAVENLGVWKDDAGVQIRVDVRRTYKAGGVFDALTGKRDLFLLNVGIYSPDLYTQLSDEVMHARERAGLPRDRRRVIELPEP